MAGQTGLSTDRFRVLVLADSRAFHTERYVTELLRQGCHVLLASLERGKMLHFRLRKRGPFGFLHYAMSATEIKALIREYKPHIVNPHFASGYGFAAALAVSGRQVPVLLHLWGSDILLVPKKSLLHRRKTAFALHSADHVIGDSEYLIQEASKLGQLRAKSVIPWGIEKQFVLANVEDKKLSVPLKIIVPRPHLDVYNNELILRELTPLIREGKIAVSFPEWGAHASSFVEKAGELIDYGITLYRKMPREDFPGFVASHDVFLSAAKSDSSPASMLEAMGLGLIPVAADIPGVREWLTEDNGYLFDSGRSGALETVIQGLLEDSNNHLSMRKANVARIRAEALFEDNVARTIEIMKSLAAAERQ